MTMVAAPLDAAVSRRALLQVGALAGAGLAIGLPAIAQAQDVVGPNPLLMKRALAALDQHGAQIANRDIMAIADFAQNSAYPRFHLVDLVSGRTTTLLVSHGRGSDPLHSGFVQRFSNDDGSLASSQGAYVTGLTYIGKHGNSRRLVGLDPTNSNAYDRSIVVHAAWYVSPMVVQQHGKIGRSEGCFAVSDADLPQVLARMGPGRMLYADKI